MRCGEHLRAGPEKVESVVRKGKPVLVHQGNLSPGVWCEMALNQNFLRMLFPDEGNRVRRVGQSKGEHLEQQGHPVLPFSKGPAH